MVRALAGRRGRDLKEYLTAYLMITPALVLIFTFGIFPVLFAVYVSLHKWKIKQGGFVGLANYLKAIDTLAYLLFFAVSIGFLFFAWYSLKSVVNLAREKGDRPWLMAFPAALHAASGLLFLRYGALLLPEILSIADKVRHLERTRALFIQLFGEALRAETVVPPFHQWIITWLIAWIITALFLNFYHNPRRFKYLNQMVNVWLFTGISVITGWFTIHEIQKAIQAGLETGEEVHIWVQIVTIASGVLLLFVAWRLWHGAVESLSNRAFLGKALAAFVFLVAGWMLVAEIPPVIQAGDKDLWLGLQVTVFYSAGTIPFQLSISLVLAFLLFQNIRGKETFRVMFFLPYVTPAVASAAVFRLLFSARPTAVVNSLFGFFGLETQKWLIQPRGVFTLLAQSAGWDNFPSWAAGPSLALVVVIIYSIWVYVGYDVVIYLAGLGNIPHEINEAAAIDGASKWQILRHVTLPLLSPTVYFLSLIAVIGTFKAFNHIFIMRDPLALGTVDTFSVAIFDEFFTKTRFGYASAMAFILFAVILSLTYINNKVQGSRVFYG